MKLKQQLVTYAFLGSLLFSYVSPVAIYAESTEATKETIESTSASAVKSSETTSSTEDLSLTDESVSVTQTSEVTSSNIEKEDALPNLTSSEKDNERVVPYEFRKSGTVDIQSFINQYAEQVIAIATPNDMYPSVMLAQGILESAAGTSDLAKLANNFFGIKFIEGVDNGTYDYVEYVSNEYINGVVVPVKSKFRKYKTPLDSFKDNAKKIRNGTIDKPDRYKGVLRSNTKTYKDATAALIAGGYATSPDYATKLNALIETWHLQRYDQGSKFSIDDLGTKLRVFGNSFTARGWVLSPYRVQDISVIYQNKVIGTGNIGILRNDVANAYPLYNQNNSGFSFSADTKALPMGKSTVTIRISLSNGETLNRNITVTRPDEAPKLYLESPNNNQVISNQQVIRGWGVALSGIQAISVSLNGVNYPITNFGLSRPDVKQAFPEYLTDKAGFSINLDTLPLSPEKTYLLRVEMLTNNGEKLSKEIQVKKGPTDIKSSIDSISEGKTYYDQSYSLSGWILSNVKINKVSVYLDTNLLKDDVAVNLIRNDVYQAYPQYQIKNSGFATSVDFSTATAGKHQLVIKLQLADGTIRNLTRNILIEKKADRFYLDTLSSKTTEVYGDYSIHGWALSAKSKFQTLKVYLNDQKIEEIMINKNREDVYQMFPQYQDRNSGFSFVLPSQELDLNKTYTLKFEFITSEGTQVTKTYQVMRKEQPKKIYLDNAPKQILYNDYSLRGWAIGNSELVDIKILDGTTSVSKDVSFLHRLDVKKLYPKNYYGTNGNGFSVTLDWSKLTSGTKSLSVVAAFKDGTTINTKMNVQIDKLDDKVYFDHPTSKITGDSLRIQGWFLSEKNVSKINATIKNSSIQNVIASQLARPDVYNFYPQYNQKNAGFSGSLDLSSLVSGNYTLVLTVTKVDGTTCNFEKKFLLEKQPIRTSIDAPTTNININNGDLTVRGWFLADEGVKEVQYLVNGTSIGRFSSFAARSDVYNAYPAYNLLNSGFSFSIANKYFKAGQNTVKLVFVTNSNRTVEKTITVHNTWTIVVDAGHGGIDSGAVGNGVYEKSINLAIALRAEEKLKRAGYTVVTTRRTDVSLGAGSLDLIERARIANENNADLFISIHQNSASTFLARGIETYYQELATTPSNGINQSQRIQKSINLAGKTQAQLIQKTGLPSRGVKCENFHVIRQTFMPAILVEGGFVTNPTDASLMKTTAHQDRMAEAIRVAVTSYIAENK